jgi:prolyl 4-hydroxylase
LIRLSSIKLQRSTIVDPQTGVHTVIEDRSSYGTFFAVNETAFIAQLDRRIAEVMHMPIENGEGLQILNYKLGGEYKTHFDYFPSADPGSAAHIAKGGQRVSTLVIYLNDVECGGETIFPNMHMSVIPKKGSAVYFEYCNSLGQVDPSSLYGGTPVVVGEKWIATKWMRQKRYD